MYKEFETCKNSILTDLNLYKMLSKSMFWLEKSLTPNFVLKASMAFSFP